MKKFFASLPQRALEGFRLAKHEQTTLDGVLKRVRKAIKEGRGIRLTKKELQTLGLHGLKLELEKEPSSWRS